MFTIEKAHSKIGHAYRPKRSSRITQQKATVAVPSYSVVHGQPSTVMDQIRPGKRVH